VDDLQAALEKLNNCFRRRVVISAPAGEGPFDPHLFAAIGRELKAKPDYIYVYNPCTKWVSTQMFPSW
jgi:hypothetical protein